MLRKVIVLALSFMSLWASAPRLAVAQDNLAATLLQDGEKFQVMRFNPGAALQKRIFADRFVPNSPEFRVTLEGVAFAGQRAEHLGTGQVRVYYAREGDWAHVSFVRRGEAGAPFVSAMVNAGQLYQAIQFNPGAALQKSIFADGFVPNSIEFRTEVDGVIYAGQRAEHLRTGRVRVYYALDGDWTNVRYVERGAAGPPPSGQIEPAAVFATAMRTYDGGFMGSARPNTLGRAISSAHETSVSEELFGRYRWGDCSYPGALFLWREDTRQIYLLPLGTGAGIHMEACRNFWQVFPDTWQPGDSNNEDLTPPPGKVIPRFGIGKVWREHFLISTQMQTLELPDAPERPATATVQQFQNATAFYFPDTGAVYVLFDRFHYLTRGGDLVGQVWFQVD